MKHRFSRDKELHGTGRKKWQSGEKRSAWLTSVPIAVFPGQFKLQPLCQEYDQEEFLEPIKPWIHYINMHWEKGKICTWFFNSLLLRLSRVIMLTYKITAWYDRVNIELTYRTSELLSCDSVQTAASDRVLHLSSCPDCSDNPAVLEQDTASQTSSGDSGDTAELAMTRKLTAVKTLPGEKRFKGNCFACDYRKSFVCSQHIKEIFGKIFAWALSFSPSAAQIKLSPCHPKVSSLWNRA